MAKQTINIGLTANDKSGDPLRTAFEKVNANFTELYSAIEATVPSTNLGRLKIEGSTLGTINDPNTGGWGGYDLYLDSGGESQAFVVIPSVANQATGYPLQIYNKGDPTSIVQVFGQGGVQIVTNTGVDEKVFEFGGDGTLDIPSTGSVRQNNSWTRTVAPIVSVGVGAVVWTSNVDYISSAKLTIQVECDEVDDATGWHSQACEAIISCRGYANVYGGPGGDPQMIVYGVVHTSINPLVTFTVQRNPTTKFVEVVGTLTAAASGNAALRIHSVEMSTRD